MERTLHGWTVAAFYSMCNRKHILGAIVSSSIIDGAHLLYSIEVVSHISLSHCLFLYHTLFIQLTQTYPNYAVSITLNILAYIFSGEKSEGRVGTQHGRLDTQPEKQEHLKTG
jgi:hypothetical protein